MSKKMWNKIFKSKSSKSSPTKPTANGTKINKRCSIYEEYQQLNALLNSERQQKALAPTTKTTTGMPGMSTSLGKQQLPFLPPDNSCSPCGTNLRANLCDDLKATTTKKVINYDDMPLPTSLTAIPVAGGSLPCMAEQPNKNNMKTQSTFAKVVNTLTLKRGKDVSVAQNGSGSAATPKLERKKSSAGALNQPAATSKQNAKKKSELNDIDSIGGTTNQIACHEPEPERAASPPPPPPPLTATLCGSTAAATTSGESIVNTANARATTASEPQTCIRIVVRRVECSSQWSVTAPSGGRGKGSRLGLEAEGPATTTKCLLTQTNNHKHRSRSNRSNSSDRRPSPSHVNVNVPDRVQWSMNAVEDFTNTVEDLTNPGRSLHVAVPHPDNSDTIGGAADENASRSPPPPMLAEPTGKLQLTACPICGRTFNPVTLQKHVGICERMTTKRRNIFDSSRQRREGTDLASYALPKDYGLPPVPGGGGGARHERGHSPKPQQVASPIMARKRPTEELSRTTARTSMRKRSNSTNNNVVPASPMPSGVNPPPSTAVTSSGGGGGGGHFTRDRLRSSERSISKRIQQPAAEQCPHCERCFGVKAYDRHVEWCKEKALQASIKHGPKGEPNVAKERLEARTKYRAPCLKSKRSMNREKYAGMPGDENENFDNPKMNNTSIMSLSMTSSFTSDRSVDRSKERHPVAATNPTSLKSMQRNLEKINMMDEQLATQRAAIKNRKSRKDSHHKPDQDVELTGFSLPAPAKAPNRATTPKVAVLGRQKTADSFSHELKLPPVAGGGRGQQPPTAGEVISKNSKKSTVRQSPAEINLRRRRQQTPQQQQQPEHHHLQRPRRQQQEDHEVLQQAPIFPPLPTLVVTAPPLIHTTDEESDEGDGDDDDDRFGRGDATPPKAATRSAMPRKMPPRAETIFIKRRDRAAGDAGRGGPGGGGGGTREVSPLPAATMDDVSAATTKLEANPIKAAKQQQHHQRQRQPRQPAAIAPPLALSAAASEVIFTTPPTPHSAATPPLSPVAPAATAPSSCSRPRRRKQQRTGHNTNSTTRRHTNNNDEEEELLAAPSPTHRRPFKVTPPQLAGGIDVLESAAVGGSSSSSSEHMSTPVGVASTPALVEPTPPTLVRNRSFILSGYDPFLSAKRQLEELCSPTTPGEAFDGDAVAVKPLPLSGSAANKMTTSLTMAGGVGGVGGGSTYASPLTPHLMRRRNSNTSNASSANNYSNNNTNNKNNSNNNTSNTNSSNNNTNTPSTNGSLSSKLTPSNFRRASSLRGPRRSPLPPARPPLFAQKHRPTIQRGLSDEGPISTNFLKPEEYDEMPVRAVCVNDYAVGVSAAAAHSPRVVRRDTSQSNRKLGMKLNINAVAANTTAGSTPGAPTSSDTFTTNTPVGGGPSVGGRQPTAALDSDEERLNAAAAYLNKTDSLAVFLKYETELEKQLQQAAEAAIAPVGVAPTTALTEGPSHDRPLISKELKDKSNNLSKQNSAKNLRVEALDAAPIAGGLEGLKMGGMHLPQVEAAAAPMSTGTNNNNNNNGSKLPQMRLEPIGKSTPAVTPTKPLTAIVQPVNQSGGLSQKMATPMALPLMPGSQAATAAMTSTAPINLNAIFGYDSSAASHAAAKKERNYSSSSSNDFIDPKLINKCDNLPVGLVGGRSVALTQASSLDGSSSSAATTAASGEMAPPVSAAPSFVSATPSNALGGGISQLAKLLPLATSKAPLASSPSSGSASATTTNSSSSTITGLAAAAPATVTSPPPTTAALVPNTQRHSGEGRCLLKRKMRLGRNQFLYDASPEDEDAGDGGELAAADSSCCSADDESTTSRHSAEFGQDRRQRMAVPQQQQQQQQQHTPQQQQQPPYQQQQQQQQQQQHFQYHPYQQSQQQQQRPPRRSAAPPSPHMPTLPLPAFDDFDFETFLSSFENDDDSQFPLFKDCREFLLGRSANRGQQRANNNNTNNHNNNNTSSSRSSNNNNSSFLFSDGGRIGGGGGQRGEANSPHFQFPHLGTPNAASRSASGGNNNNNNNNNNSTFSMSEQHHKDWEGREKSANAKYADERKAAREDARNNNNNNNNDNSSCADDEDVVMGGGIIGSRSKGAPHKNREIFISIETETDEHGGVQPDDCPSLPLSPSSLRSLVGGNAQTVVEVALEDANDNKFSRISDDDETPPAMQQQQQQKPKPKPPQRQSSSSTIGGGGDAQRLKAGGGVGGQSTLPGIGVGVAPLLPNVQLNNAKNLIQKMQDDFRQMSEEMSANLRQAVAANTSTGTAAAPTSVGATPTSAYAGECPAARAGVRTAPAGGRRGEAEEDSDEMSSLDGYPISSQSSSRRGVGSKLSADSAYGSLSRQRSSELSAHRSLSRARPATAGSNTPATVGLQDMLGGGIGGAPHQQATMQHQHHHRQQQQQQQQQSPAAGHHYNKYANLKSRARQFSDGSTSSGSDNSLPPIHSAQQQIALSQLYSNNNNNHKNHKEFLTSSALKPPTAVGGSTASGPGATGNNAMMSTTPAANAGPPGVMLHDMLADEPRLLSQSQSSYSLDNSHVQLNSSGGGGGGSSSGNNSMSSSMLLKMSKFCHECGGKFVVEQAKFCMDCGVRRIVL